MCETTESLCDFLSLDQLGGDSTSMLHELKVNSECATKLNLEAN